MGAQGSTQKPPSFEDTFLKSSENHRNVMETVQPPQEPKVVTADPHPVHHVPGHHDRLFNLLLKTVESSLGLMVFFMHAGELHILSSLLTSRAGMFYTTTTSLLPVYLLARASSAIWERPWIAFYLDAVMNIFNAYVYACAAVALSWSLEGVEHFFQSFMEKSNDAQILPARIPPQQTKLNQPIAWIRFSLAILLSALLLLEGLAALCYWPYKILQYLNIFKHVANKKAKTRKTEKDDPRAEMQDTSITDQTSAR